MRRRTLGGLTIGAAIVGGVGIVLLAAGVFTMTYVPRMLDTERARLVRLPVVEGAAASDTPAGREVVVEGRISAEQPAVFRDFVAYVSEEREQTEGTPDPWRWRERRTPHLLIETPGGGTRVVNDTYDLRNPEASWIDPRTINRVERRYSGLRPGEPVVIVGTTAAGGVAAEFVAPGTRESYLRSQERGALVARWLGRLLAGVGFLLILIAGALFMLSTRRTMASGSG